MVSERTLLYVFTLFISASYFLQYALFGTEIFSQAIELLAFIAVIFIVFNVRHKTLYTYSYRTILPIIIYALFVFAGTALNGNPGANSIGDVFTDIFLDAKLYIFALLIMVLSRGGGLEDLISKICKVLVVIALINLPFVLRDAVLGGVSINGTILRDNGLFSISVGVFDHKLKSVTAMLFGTIAACSLLMNCRSRQMRLVYYALAGIFAVSIPLHASAKEMVGVLIVAAFYLLLRTRAGPKRIVAACIIMPAFVLGLATFDNPMRDRLVERFDTFLGDEGLNTVRTRSYVGAFQIASEHAPVGSGAATFMSKGARDTYSPYYYQTGIATLYGGTEDDRRFLMDSFWPKVIAQSGFIGAAIYFLLAITLLRKSISNLISHPGIATFFSASVLSTSFVSSFVNPIYTHDYALAVIALSIAHTALSFEAGSRFVRRPVERHAAHAGLSHVQQSGASS